MYRSKRDVTKLLKKHGYEFLRQGGKHEIWWHPETKKKVPVWHAGVDSKEVFLRMCKRLGIKP